MTNIHNHWLASMGEAWQRSHEADAEAKDMHSNRYDYMTQLAFSNQLFLALSSGTAAVPAGTFMSCVY